MSCSNVRVPCCSHKHSLACCRLSNRCTIPFIGMRTGTISFVYILSTPFFNAIPNVVCFNRLARPCTNWTATCSNDIQSCYTICSRCPKLQDMEQLRVLQKTNPLSSLASLNLNLTTLYLRHMESKSNHSYSCSHLHVDVYQARIILAVLKNETLINALIFYVFNDAETSSPYHPGPQIPLQSC